MHNVGFLNIIFYIHFNVLKLNLSKEVNFWKPTICLSIVNAIP